MKKFVVIILLTLISGLFANAQDIIEINRTSQEIVLDGMPDEIAWEKQRPFPLSMHTPVYRGKPTEKTDVRMCFDDSYLYVGAKLFYNDISKMLSSGKKRDYAQPTCDWFGIHLDTYNDRQNALLFYTNPNGLRLDAAVKNDFQSMEQDANLSWNTYWEVKTSRDDEGWYAEMRIPLSSLRFQEENGLVKMGLSVARFMPANNEMLTYPDITPEYNQANWKPSLAGVISFKGLKSRKPFYISPYVIAGTGHVSELNEAETAYNISKTPKLDAGLDLKMGVSNNLTVDLTLNTDFAQVEADDQQINLSRFSLFFPEKRVFFQEKSDVFDFQLGGPSKLFYSRRIGLYEDEPVRILGGVRMTGREGKWDIGLLNMQTAKMSELASENFGVVRLKRTVFNENSYIGGMMTSRIGMDGKYNFAYGLDGTVRLFGNEYVSLRLAQTNDSEINSNPFSKNPSKFHLTWQRRGEKGFGYDFTLSYSGDQFNPGTGFEVKDDYSAALAMFNYGWYPSEASNLQRHKAYTRTMIFRSLLDGKIETATHKTGWNFETRSGLTGDLAHNIDLEVLTDTLEFNDDVNINPGRYTFQYLSTEWMLPPVFPIIGVIKTEAGTFYDGWKISATLMPTWSAGPSFDLSGTYRLDWVSLAARNMSFVNHIIGLKAMLTFTTQTSLAGFVQYNTAIDGVVANVRFRYNPREGVDLYLVYNEGLNTNPYTQKPVMPVSDNRTVMLKFTYTLGL